MVPSSWLQFQAHRASREGTRIAGPEADGTIKVPAPAVIAPGAMAIATLILIKAALANRSVIASALGCRAMLAVCRSHSDVMMPVQRNWTGWNSKSLLLRQAWQRGGSWLI
jgi:hypothetical protein